MRKWGSGIRKVLDCVLARRTPQASVTDCTTGRRAEQLAEDYLVRRGARILARNARCKGGEIDLIALHNACVLFVEVRLRSHPGFGGAASSVTHAKQRRLAIAARHWLGSTGKAFRNHPCRFDVLAMNGLESGSPGPEWIRGAFDMESF